MYLQETKTVFTGDEENLHSRRRKPLRENFSGDEDSFHRRKMVLQVMKKVLAEEEQLFVGDEETVCRR